MKIDQEAYAALDPEQRKLADELLAAAGEILEQNPLEGFHACPEWCGSPSCPPPSERNPSGGRPKQHEFMTADNKMVAAFAGNRFGKTTANVVWALIQHAPDQMVPERLKKFRRERESTRAVTGRYLTDKIKTFETVVIPELRLWLPNSLLRGGSWEKGFSKSQNIVYFADGGRLEFYSYDQDASGMAGASLDYVIYDEPPPVGHFRENWIRTTDRLGTHRFGMTPVNMQGGGIGWIHDEIFEPADQGEAPHITIVRGSIWDNPDLSPEEVELTLSQYPADERQAREKGDFIHFGGMVYPGGFEHILRKPLTPDEVKRLDVIVGIDPGLKNAAFIWVAFDNDNRAIVFEELLLKESTPKDYVAGIDYVNKIWGLKAPRYVIDPSARNRPTSGVGESVESLLMSHGIYCSWGQNDVQAGCQQVRDRIRTDGLYVVGDKDDPNSGCAGIRREAKKYRMEEGEEFKVVKENDHRLDALRYACMERLWWRDVPHEDKVQRDYSDPTFEPPFDPYAGVAPEYGPMGPWS